MTDVVTLSTCCTWATLGVSVGKRNAWRQQMYWMPLTGFSVSITHSFNGRRKDLQHTKTKPKKATTVFYSISPHPLPNVARRFTKYKEKSFHPVAGRKAKEQNENIRNSQCERRRLGSFSLLLHFPSFTFPLLFFWACSPKRDVQKLNGNQHITSGKICVNKVVGVKLRWPRPLPEPLVGNGNSGALRKLRDLRSNRLAGRDLRKSAFKPPKH